ncbi:hypothetical protein M8J77_008646 [Diaphorina citri]|nr:hypothetical protein M8J77_008646 [Diaphorina citri]
MSKLNQEDNRWNRKRPHKSEPCHLSGQNEVLQLKMKPSTTQILTELKPYHSKLKEKEEEEEKKKEEEEKEKEKEEEKEKEKEKKKEEKEKKKKKKKKKKKEKY